MSAVFFFVGSLLSREGLKELLAGSGFPLNSEPGTLVEAHCLLCAAQAENEDPQILLLYSKGAFEGEDGEITRAVRRDQSPAKMIILGDPVALGLLSQTRPTAIDRCLLQDVTAAELMRSLHLITSGHRSVPPDHPAAMPGRRSACEASNPAHATSGLSAGDAQILKLPVGGSANKSIGRNLTISVKVVKVHMKALLGNPNAPEPDPGTPLGA
jgi:DNA-binding NarL/FixJ family response regulator